jgi:hypothetical protein
MASSLHPNLARLAAAYDDVMERYAHRQLSPQQARDQILALVARDDNGVVWSISPDTGRWQYRNSHNELVAAEPPAYGFASLTAHDLTTASDAYDPDARISFYEVDDNLLHAPGSLLGSTRVAPRSGLPIGKVAAALVTMAVIVAAAVLLLV